MSGHSRWWEKVRVAGHLSREEEEILDFEAMQFSSYTCAMIRLSPVYPSEVDGIEWRMRMYPDLVNSAPGGWVPMSVGMDDDE